MNETEIIAKSLVTSSVHGHPTMRGPGNPRWNGGVSEYQDHYLLKKARIEKLKSVQGKCEICGERAGLVHHIDETTSNHDLSNLLAVCRACHRILHNTEIGGCKTSKYIRIFGMILEELANITGLSSATVMKWSQCPKKHEVLVRAMQNRENAVNIIRASYYKRETER